MPTRHTPLHRRLGWLVLIWCASVLSLGSVAWVFRQIMAAVGLAPP